MPDPAETSIDPAAPLRADAPAAPDRSLDRALVRGVAWTALVKWGSQVLSWGAVVVLARVLSPSDYGIVGMATLYLGFMNILTEGGLSTSIVAMRQMTASEIAQFNSVAALLGLFGALATCAAALPLGWFFRSPELPLVVVALSANALLSAVRLVPGAVLQRDLRFRGLALVDGVQSIASTIVTLTLALLGARYWALVAGAVTGSLAAAGASLWLSPARLARPRRGSLGKYFGFTRDILVGRIAWFCYTNADFVVAGRMLGSAALGAYTFAWNIASVPVEKVTAMVSRVTPALFSRLQTQRDELTRMLLHVTEGLTILTLPASVGMALVADDFVAAYLGPQWGEAVLPLQILALYATFRSVVTLMPQALTMLGHTRFLMMNGLATGVTLPIGFFVGSRFGPGGIAAVWLFVYPMFVVPLYARAFRALGLSLGRYLGAVWQPVRAVAIMAAAVLAVRVALPEHLGSGARLAAEIAVGGAAYFLTGILPLRHRLRRIGELLRNPATAPVAAR